jgi:hypothetical protein
MEPDAVARFDAAFQALWADQGQQFGYLQTNWWRDMRAALVPWLTGAVDAPAAAVRHDFVTHVQRAGLSTVLAVVAAALALSRPGGTILCMAMTGRWLALVLRLLTPLQTSPGWAWSWVQRNDRERFVIRNVTGHTVDIIALSETGGLDNFRGMGERTMCVLVDQFASMQAPVLQQLQAIAVAVRAPMLCTSYIPPQPKGRDEVDDNDT